MEDQRLVDAVVKAVTQALDDRGTIEKSLHRKHHDYIDVLLVREQRRAERWESIKAHVYGWGIITAITGIGALVWNYIAKHGGHQ